MTKAIGVILIVIGVAGLIWGGFTFTTKKNVVDLGPIKAQKTEHHTVPIAPIAGAVALIGGVVLIASGRR